MTDMQHFMLSICFGAVIGWMAGNLISIIGFAIREVCIKHRKRKEAKEAANMVE